jgi:regulator of ribonuclease activity A
MSAAWSTTDLCDANEALLETGALRVLAPGWLIFGRNVSFAGRARTLRLFEDNSTLARRVKVPGDGGVLVVDGGGSARCAVFGGNLARAAQDNGWVGLIIAGAVRDADEIDACEVGVRALALHPRRSAKRGQGEEDVAVMVGGSRVSPGDWIYADRDGILVSDRALVA